MENRLHPLSSFDGEDDIRQIVTIVLDLIMHNVPTHFKHIDHNSIIEFREVTWRISRETYNSKMVILHCMGLIIPQGMFG